MKVLGEDQCVWTQGVSAEHGLLQVSNVLRFRQTSTLQCFTHFVNTVEENTEKYFVVELSFALYSTGMSLILTLDLKIKT